MEEIEEKSEYAFYLELDGTNYHHANILGMGVSTREKNYFVPYVC